MIRKHIRKIISIFFDPDNFIYHLSNDTGKEVQKVKNYGYLHETGWTNSLVKKKPVNVQFEPIPWLTYPCISFIEERLRADMQVFEYGAGNSTLFFSARVLKVVSVEYDKQWYDSLIQNCPSNVMLIYNSNYDEQGYIASINTGIKYDLVLIDGLYRMQCAEQAINKLSPAGVIILDDSEREEYQSIFKLMLEEGFKNLSFWGMAPNVITKTCTTIFYRNLNCFDL